MEKMEKKKAKGRKLKRKIKKECEPKRDQDRQRSLEIF